MLTDRLGQEIKSGVWIIYGHALHRSAGLRMGKVIEAVIGEPERELTPWNRQDRITVWGIDDDSSEYHKFRPEDEWAKPRALEHKSTLLYSSRCVVIPEALVPEQYRKLVEEKMKEI